LARALDDETTRKRLIELGFLIPPGEARTPAALRDLVAAEVSRWRAVIADQPVKQN
jgi:hypothetical protein